MFIGIDLGTSNSVVAGVVEDGARVFRPADGGDTLPSAIYIDKRGHRLYGRRAYDQLLIAPENVASGFKRLMGTSTPIEVRGADITLSPEECASEIITQLLGQIATDRGDDDVIEGAILTIPATFNQMQTEATLRAAHLAGLERVDLLQEPIAAGLAAMAGAKRSGRFIIYDLGGGTFDVALVESTDGDVRILAQHGVNMLGGRDFDRLIVQNIVRPWLAANFDLPDNFHRDAPYRRLMRVAQTAAERAKIDLSSLEEASIFASDDEVRLMDQSETEIFLDVPITRSQLEELIREPILQTINVVRALLDEAEQDAADIDRIVFVGGPSRIPFVRRLVTEELGIAADLKTDPMTAVAVGAAYYAESRDWGGVAQVSSHRKETAVEEQAETGIAPLSTPKESQTSAQMTDATEVSFDYASRTPDDKTVLTMRVAGEPIAARQVRLSNDTWHSGVLPLVDGLTIMVPLPNMGEHDFRVRVLDENGDPIRHHDQTLTITRVVATASRIPAAHTIAVKTREDLSAEENILMPLVVKGMELPASGEAKFRSSCALRADAPGSLSFELFQVEYPDRIDLNLCVGVFRIDGGDLPEGQSIRTGDPVVFAWTMSDGGILRATVKLPAQGVELPVPRFYAPQAGEISFDSENGPRLARAVLDRGDAEWGELAAAIGPQAGPDIDLLRTRLVEQREIAEEELDNPEALRQVVEESRYIRQDIARAGQRHAPALLQRQLGRLTAAYNRTARGKANTAENTRFDAAHDQIQHVIDEKSAAKVFIEAAPAMAEMRRVFFAVAWRDTAYVHAWFEKLAAQPFLYPDKGEFATMVETGEQLAKSGDEAAFAAHVRRMLDSRVALGSPGLTDELAQIVRVG